MDGQQTEVRELRGLVQALEVQVCRMDTLLSGLAGQQTTVVAHGEAIAGIQVWRLEHDKQHATRAAQRSAWSGFAGALIMKLFDWAHAHFNLSGLFGSGH